MNKKKGFFITFEGCEGTGKSTQSKKLYEYLKTKNNKIIYTREPGGCKEAEQIRKILVNGHVNKWDGITESLLHNAARKIHLEKTIIPALNNNNWVICDRFIDSTNAYQGAGQGVPIDFLKNLSNIVCQDIRPDLTIVFDMDIEKSLNRINTRMDKNRYEKFDINFHKKINQYFKSLKNKNKRYFFVDADDTINNIFNKIIKEIHKRKMI